MKYINKTVKCTVCASKQIIDYKLSPALLSFVDYYGRIKKSYFKGTCRKHQANIALAVKRARHMGLLSFTR